MRAAGTKFLSRLPKAEADGFGGDAGGEFPEFWREVSRIVGSPVPCPARFDFLVSSRNQFNFWFRNFFFPRKLYFFNCFQNFNEKEVLMGFSFFPPRSYLLPCPSLLRSPSRSGGISVITLTKLNKIVCENDKSITETWINLIKIHIERSFPKWNLCFSVKSCSSPSPSYPASSFFFITLHFACFRSGKCRTFVGFWSSADSADAAKSSILITSNLYSRRKYQTPPLTSLFARIVSDNWLSR